MPELRWLMKKSGIASSILNFIMEHMDYHNALCCSYAVFMDYFEVSKPTVSRAIKLLKDNGFIDVLKSGTSNVYIVNHEVAWTSYGEDKKMCKFTFIVYWAYFKSFVCHRFSDVIGLSCSLKKPHTAQPSFLLERKPEQ